MPEIKFNDDCLLFMLGDGSTGITSMNGKDGFGALGFSRLKEKYNAGDKVEDSDDPMFFVIEFQNIDAAISMQKVLDHTIEQMKVTISKLDASLNVHPESEAQDGNNSN